MTPENWKRVLDIHADALELPQAQREAFVREAAAGDQEVLGEVMSLLEVEIKEGEMEPPRPGPAQTAEAANNANDKGERQLGDYLLGGTLGQGATGTVFRAHDTKLDRDVAVKVLETGLTTTPSQVARFRSEPQRIARLRHSNIINIHATGHVGTTSWFAMELIDGHDLAKELDLQRNHSHAALLPAPSEGDNVRRTAMLCADVADALQTAHNAGIVHRDVKPQNLLLDEGGKVHLVDFGLARDERLGAKSPTMTGMVLGTVHYMSPEQTQAAQAKVDARTDVYSLGVVLYEMLTLAKPFDGGSQEEVWHRIRTAEPRSIRKVRASVPRDLELIVGKAMARDAKERYRTAKAFGDDLRRFLAFESIEAKAPTMSQRARRLAARNWRVLAAAFGAILFAAVGWSWSTLRAEQSALDDVVARTSATISQKEVPPPIVLARLREDIATLQADRAQPATSLAREANTRLDVIETDWVREKDELIELGRDRNDSEQLVRAQLLLMNLAFVFPERSTYVRDAGSNLFAPRLIVELTDESGNAIDGEVFLRRIDPITGQPGPAKLAGSLPLAETTTPEGYFRVRIETRTHGLREFSRMLRPSVEPIRIALELGLGRDHASMQSIPVQPVYFDDPDSEESGIQRRQLQVEAFEIDTYEVSNAQYRQFLAANPTAKKPIYWDRITPGSREDRLPVTCLSWYDVLDYCEWRGLRLATHAEWMLAARTADGHRFPGGQDGYSGNTLRVRTHPGNLEERIQDYLANTVPVDELAGPPSGHDLFHTLGNVMEWTESLQPERHRGQFLIRWGSRCACGSDWTARSRNTDLRVAITTAGPEDGYAQRYRGFRCARTIR